jgi:hypothetical protein
MRNASHSIVIHTNFKSIIKTTTELIKKASKIQNKKKIYRSSIAYKLSDERK